MFKKTYILSLSILLSIYHSCFAAIDGLPQYNDMKSVKYKDSWYFYLQPYFWLAGLSGHSNIQGNRANFNMGNIRKALDFSLGAHFEASRYPWTLMLDPAYVKITQNLTVNYKNTHTIYETTITDGGIYYHLLPNSMPYKNNRSTSLELFGGGRIMAIHTQLTFLNALNPQSDTSGFLVPLIGARVQYHLNNKIHTWFSGDFGGFRINHVNTTWSSIAGISYSLTPNFNISLAYKALGLSYSKHVITINSLLQGPILACALSW